MARSLNTDKSGFDGDASWGSEPDGGKARHRVLLVEDHAGFAEATAALMRHHGLDVSIATSGGDALKLAEECNPVLVLCDLALPDMTGLDVVQALRARRGANDWLAVILSARSANDLREIEGHTKASEITLLLSQAAHEPNSHRPHCQTRGVAALGGLGVRSLGPLTEPGWILEHDSLFFLRRRAVRMTHCSEG